MTEELLSGSPGLTTGKDKESAQPLRKQDDNKDHRPVPQTGRGAVSFQSNNDMEEDGNSGLEPELDDPEIKIERPFNPEKIKVRTVNIVVEQLVSRVKYDEIDLAPDFQRSFVWNLERKCRLIESLLLRIPIPMFYVAANEKENWSVVDGVQRISTIFDYVTDRFSLSRLEYLLKFDGMKYNALPRPMQRRIGETQLVVNIIEPGTPEDVMFNIFRRINTGGMTLKGQEIRNALHPGPVRKYLMDLAKTKEFLDATDYSINKKRMADRECVLRFMAFYLDPWENYNINDLDGYLNRTMTKINTMTPELRNAVAEDFKKAMRAAHSIFIDDAFRKRYDRSHYRCPISKALFETWSVQLARCSPTQINKLVNGREAVIDRFTTLMNEDNDFEKAISYATGTPQRVTKRFSAIQELVGEMVSCSR